MSVVAFPSTRSRHKHLRDAPSSVVEPAPLPKGGRMKSRAPFTITPKAVRVYARDHGEPLLTQLYTTLCEFANADGVCWPSQATLAEESAISARKVHQLLKLLEEGGFLHIEHRRYVNLYTLLDPDDGLHDVQSDTDDGLHQVHVTLHPVHGRIAPDAVPLTRTTELDPVEQETPPSPPKREPSLNSTERRMHELVDLWKRLAGITQPLASPPWAEARALCDAGCTDAELRACFVRVKAWATKTGPKMGLIVKELDALRAEQSASKPAPLTKDEERAAAAEHLAYLRRGQFTGKDYARYRGASNGADNLALDIDRLEAIVAGVQP